MAGDAIESDEGKSSVAAVPMISKRGWVIVIAVVLLEAAIFGIIYFAKSGTDSIKQDATTEGKVSYQVPMIFRSFNHTLNDLAYSVPGPSGDTLTLAMTINVQLGLLEEELEKKDPRKYPTPAQMAIFLEVVKGMESDMRGYLLSTVSSIPLSQLNKNDGRERITSGLMEFVNQELEKTEFPPEIDTSVISPRRVTSTVITQFILQQ